MDRKRRPGQRAACLVDAYSTGAQLGCALADAGWWLLHAQSAPAIPKPFAKSFRPSDFDVLFELTGSVDELADRVREHEPEFVVAGSEPGTPLAEELAAALGLPGNDPRTSALRRNKYAMAEALVEAGVPAVRQVRVADERAAVMAADQLGSWPVIVKPVDAAGSEGVRLCHHADDVRNAFNAIHLHTNFLGLVNEVVLVQEYLVGQQYMLNAVSMNGAHRITEIWKEDRLALPGAGILYDKEIMIPYEGDVQARLISYTRRVLDAIGVREGASHTELVLTKRGPILLETAARMQGGLESAAIVEAIGESHMTMTLMRYADPTRFASHIHDQYEIAKTPMVVNLIATRGGIVRENNMERLLRTLPSFFMASRTPEVGARIERTVDLLTKTGHIYLMHRDPAQLEADYQKIREWEVREMFIVFQDPEARPDEMSVFRALAQELR